MIVILATFGVRAAKSAHCLPARRLSTRRRLPLSALEPYAFAIHSCAGAWYSDNRILLGALSAGEQIKRLPTESGVSDSRANVLSPGLSVSGNHFRGVACNESLLQEFPAISDPDLRKRSSRILAFHLFLDWIAPLFRFRRVQPPPLQRPVVLSRRSVVLSQGLSGLQGT